MAMILCFEPIDPFLLDCNMKRVYVGVMPRAKFFGVAINHIFSHFLE